MSMAACSPTVPQWEPNCENPKMNGAPINCIWYMAVSDHIKTAPRERLAEIILLPSVNRCEPAVFVAVGSHILTSSCAHHRMNMSSCVESSPMVVSVPKRTMKRSVPETSMPLLLVGAFETVVLVAMLVMGSDNPPEVSQ